MKKQEKINYRPLQAVLFIAFVCLYLAGNFPVFDLQKTAGVDSMLQAGFFIADLSNNSQNPEENIESEAETFSESIFPSIQIEHPVFGFLKKKPGYRSDLFFPDHLELFSPPPESWG